MARTYPSSNTCPFDHDMTIGLGLMANQTRVSALGRNLIINTTSGVVDIWGGGGAYPFQTSAVGYEIISDNVADTAAGTGAQTVSLMLLDGSYNQVPQIVTMNGTTAVQISGGPYLAINQAIVLTAGSNNANVGNITVRVTGAGANQSYMVANTSVAQIALYTVPNGSTLYITAMLFAVNNSTGNSSALFADYTRSTAGVIRTPLEINLSTGTDPYRHELKYGLTVAQKTSFGLRCLSVTQNGTSVTGAFEGVLVNNNITT